MEAQKAVKTVKVSKFQVIIYMMFSPANVLKSALEKIPWIFAVLISSLAFGLFFLQTGFDLYKTGQKNIDFVVISAISGIFYGAFAIPILATLVWMLLRFSKTEKSLKWVISSICLSYSGALIYGIVGIIFSLFLAWKTSVAFGATGVLWATGPMIVSIRAATDGKNALSIPIATVICVVVLLSWSIFGQI